MAVSFGASGRNLNRTANLPVATTFTICGWVYIHSINGATFEYFACLENTAGTNFCNMGFNNSGTFQVSCTNGDSNFATNPPTGQWLFFAMTRSTTTAIGYWAKQFDTTLTSVSNSNIGALTVQQLTIGNDVSDEFADVYMAYVKVWNAVLTSTELLAERLTADVVRNGNKLLSTPLWYPGDVRDYSGNGNNWTVGGTLSTQPGPSIGVRDFGLAF